MSSGLLIMSDAVRSDTAAFNASSDGYPLSSSGSVITLNPAVAAVAGLQGCAWIEVITSSLCASSPRAAWKARVTHA